MSKAALWVMGALDELQSLGIVDIGGDRPLENRAQRLDYRLLKQDYTPTMEEIDAILRRCVCADDLPGFHDLFRCIVEHGWDRVKEERAKARAEEVRDQEIRDTYGWPDDWIPL